MHPDEHIIFTTYSWDRKLFYLHRPKDTSLLHLSSSVLPISVILYPNSLLYIHIFSFCFIYPAHNPSHCLARHSFSQLLFFHFSPSDSRGFAINFTCRKQNFEQYILIARNVKFYRLPSMPAYHFSSQTIWQNTHNTHE